jgi:aspartyl-tRNA(Asn)/glutamyl-tRNA(Gln) amidotransferase subunit A
MAGAGFWRMSAVELLDGYGRREFSPVEVLDELLDRIEKLNPILYSFLAVNTEDAKAAARKAEAQWLTPGEKQPLLGLPVSIKDTFEMKGLPTTYGSKAFADNYQDDAEMVHRLRVAGAVITGKTQTPEFALAGPINSKISEPPTNPWNLAHTPGFSSAGAGSAVAVGLGPLALGTDSGGSVRIPAAYCGIYGLKPTYQRIPAVQEWRAGPDRSHTGPMTRTVRDSAVLMQALAGFDPRDPDSNLPDADYLSFTGGNVRNMRVALSYTLGGTVKDPDPEIIALVKEAAELLRDLGCSVVEDDPPTIDTLEELEPGTWAYSGDHYRAAEAIKPNFWENHADDLTDQLQPVYEAGRRALAWQYRGIIRRNRLFETQMREWFRSYDFLLTPAAGAAPRLDTIENRKNRGGPVSGYFTLFNHAHIPAAAVPFGFHSNGMPLAVQIVGQRENDIGVLRISAAIEAAKPWAQNWPALAEDLSLAAR